MQCGNVFHDIGFIGLSLSWVFDIASVAACMFSSAWRCVTGAEPHSLRSACEAGSHDSACQWIWTYPIRE